MHKNLKCASKKDKLKIKYIYRQKIITFDDEKISINIQKNHIYKKI